MKIENKPVYIFSDLHLGDHNCDVGAIMKILDEIESREAYIVIAGDLVDALAGNHNKILENKVYKQIIERISKRLLSYVIGNHDLPALKDIKCRIHWSYPFSVVEVDGEKWSIEHGHLIGKWSWMFRALDFCNQWKPFRVLSSWIIKTRVLGVSGRSWYGAKMIEDACHRAADRGCSVAINGHSHKEMLSEYVNSEVPEIQYVNPGSGIRKLSYVLYENGSFRIAP